MPRLFYPPLVEPGVLIKPKGTNYSWQGRLKWPAAGKEAVFHSVLELIFLLETDLNK